jgi:hypothetical protein
VPEYEMVWLPHPVAVLDEGQIRQLAREVAVDIVRGLTGH